jgi:arylsulfatase
LDVIIAQGSRYGGWTFYAKDGVLKFVYNVLGINEYRIEATRPIPGGKHQVRAEFAYDGGGIGKGGNVILYYEGQKVGKGRVNETQGYVFSADETTYIGYESGTTVSKDYTVETSRFNSKLNWVHIDLGEDDHDRMVDPEHVIHVAMSRQ